jgi:CubicO group peptidase (beta-lactamase class C family)
MFPDHRSPSDRGVVRQRLARGHRMAELLSVWDGAAYGGLVGSVADAARFAQMHLRDGALDGQRIISAASAARMRNIRVPGRRYDLGLGWFRPRHARRAQPAYVEHLGGGAGFWNAMRLYPDLRLAVVMMGNATRYDHDAISAAIVDHMARRR